MKKVGIITINGNVNFGNRLQNYALQHTIENLGYHCDTIWFCNFRNYIKEKIKKTIFYFTNKRKYYFLKFSRQHINTKYYRTNQLSNKYDKFVAGSDQIWNYNFPDFNENMLLLFSNKNNNISYAASFGVSHIIPEKKELFIQGLSNFKNISVREDKGKEIIEDLIPTQKVDVVLDPTMLLTSSDWEKLMKKPKNIENKKYILNYFLGNVSEKRANEIIEFAQKHNCEIINILDPKDKFYNCGPSEFLYLEKNAFLICTDSFHSSVFAILFERPFVIFNREDKEENMNSRIETLLAKLNIQNHQYQGKITDENLVYDYTNSFKLLDIERKKSLDFLKNSLSDNK